MPTTIKITSRLQITPLLVIQHEAVTQSYREGVSNSLRHADKPIPLTFLLICLKRAIAVQVFDGQHQEAARDFVGFHLGRIHGAVLTVHGACRRDVTTLVLLGSKDALRGYRAGRRWFFEEATAQERCLTDTYMVERFEELAREAPAWRNDPDGTWQFALASLIGEFSGYLFPVMPQEQARWERERQHVLAWLAQQEARVARSDTEPLNAVPVVEYTI